MCRYHPLTRRNSNDINYVEIATCPMGINIILDYLYFEMKQRVNLYKDKGIDEHHLKQELFQCTHLAITMYFSSINIDTIDIDEGNSPCGFMQILPTPPNKSIVKELDNFLTYIGSTTPESRMNIRDLLFEFIKQHQNYINSFEESYVNETYEFVMHHLITG